MHSIIIKTYPSDSAKNDVVRLSPEAAEIIREYQWETGITAPTAKRLLEVAKLYNCTVDELLSADNQTKGEG